MPYGTGASEAAASCGKGHPAAQSSESERGAVPGETTMAPATATRTDAKDPRYCVGLHVSVLRARSRHEPNGKRSLPQIESRFSGGQWNPYDVKLKPFPSICIPQLGSRAGLKPKSASIWFAKPAGSSPS